MQTVPLRQEFEISLIIPDKKHFSLTSPDFNWQGDEIFILPEFPDFPWCMAALSTNALSPVSTIVLAFSAIYMGQASITSVQAGMWAGISRVFT